MHSTEPGNFPVTVYVHRSRMRAFAQVGGGVLLGLGLAAAVGPNPGLVRRYPLGLGALVLYLGLLLPENAGDHPDRSCPHPD